MPAFEAHPGTLIRFPFSMANSSLNIVFSSLDYCHLIRIISVFQKLAGRKQAETMANRRVQDHQEIVSRRGVQNDEAVQLRVIQGKGGLEGKETE